MAFFRHTDKSLVNLRDNAQHQFALNYALMFYRKNIIGSYIPKNACSTLRLTAAVENGCISGPDKGHWIHSNNHTFKPSLSEALRVDYSFIVLRCPYKRLASVFLDKFASKTQDAWQFRAAMGRTVDIDSLTFKEFVKLLKSHSMLRANPHWRPQTDYLLFNKYDDYFSLERFSEAQSALESNCGLQLLDARGLTNHGTERFELVSDGSFSNASAFELSVMKQAGKCPSHSALYDDETFELVSTLFSLDIKFYKVKCNESDLLRLQ